MDFQDKFVKISFYEMSAICIPPFCSVDFLLAFLFSISFNDGIVKCRKCNNSCVKSLLIIIKVKSKPIN